MTTPYTATDGLAVLGPELVEVRDRLEGQLLALADGCDATRMSFPSLLPVSDLLRFDYFQNFPQLALLTAELDLAEMKQNSIGDQIPERLLRGTGHALTSAACYSIYLHLRDSRLPSSRYLTTVATCYRNEKHYDGLRRLRAFTMREIVCVGTGEAVQQHLATFKPKIQATAEALGLQLDVTKASDPFFMPSSSRALQQRLFPVKEEFVHDGSLAIASVNFHRNFFGERCSITMETGEVAHTGCVAFGLERWLAALLDVHGDPAEVLRAFDKLAA